MDLQTFLVLQRGRVQTDPTLQTEVRKLQWKHAPKRLSPEEWRIVEEYESNQTHYCSIKAAYSRMRLLYF